MSHRVVTVPVAQASAGAGVAFTPSGQEHVLLLAVAATLTTDATVASRRPALILEDQNGLQYWGTDAGQPQAASLAVRYSWSRGASLGPPNALVASQRVALPLPWLRLEPEDTVNLITALEDTSDQWSNVVYRAIIGDLWEREQELAHLAQAFTQAATG